MRSREGRSTGWAEEASVEAVVKRCGGRGRQYGEERGANSLQSGKISRVREVGPRRCIGVKPEPFSLMVQDGGRVCVFRGASAFRSVEQKAWVMVGVVEFQYNEGIVKGSCGDGGKMDQVSGGVSAVPDEAVGEMHLVKDVVCKRSQWE